MIQYSITLIIIALVVFITARRIFLFFKNPTTGCDGCHQSCSGCSLDDLKKEIAEKNALNK